MCQRDCNIEINKIIAIKKNWITYTGAYLQYELQMTIHQIVHVLNGKQKKNVQLDR